ncbi:MAG TPA: HEAT repeat domain-containing protein [Myxococcaceae bacterium]|nr:HEAT repeat domain-containing protein [Myxococcaceae bacterium]
MSEAVGWRRVRDEALLALQRATRADERTAAARRLRDLAEESEFHAEAEAVWTKLLGDQQEEVRRAGVEMAVRCLGTQAAGSLLRKLVGDPSALVRVQVAGSLADLEDPAYRPELGALLADSESSIRFEAARGLAALGDASGIDVLTASLAEPEVRFRALGALAALGDSRAVPAIRALFQRLWLPPYERTQAAGVLMKLGDEEAGGYLIQRTRGGGVDRAFAIELCGEVKARGARARLEEILADPADSYRGAAARGLGRLGDSSAAPLLLSVVQNPQEADELRLDAAEGYCRLVGAEQRGQIAGLPQLLKSDSAKEEARELLAWYG